jgi:hypothetical protein
MSSASADPEVMALKAAVKALFRAVAEHYENEIGFRSELRRRAAAFIDEERLEAPNAEAGELRSRAKDVLAHLLSDRARA